MVKVLVIGYGSIGSRHARILQSLGCDVSVVSRRPIDFVRVHKCITDALKEGHPRYVVMASRTNEHHSDLSELARAGFNGRVLVEKPLFERRRSIPDNSFSHLAVAYNLRFHPLIQKLRAVLAGEECVTAHVYVGQYLPSWRPGTDYRHSYSSSVALGGGVLRDLSHELDYIAWLFGPWRRMTAAGGHWSDLAIDSDDVFSLFLAPRRCRLVTLQLNYLDRVSRREILVHTCKHSIRVDMVKGVFEIDGEVESAPLLDRDFTYLAEHRAMLDGDMRLLADAASAQDVVETICAAEEAARERVWVER